MPRRITSTQASAKLGEMIKWTEQSGDDVIIESRGVPRAALVSMDEYENLVRWREAARREKALSSLRALRRRVRQRNEDLDTQQAADLADRAAREIIEDMIDEGSIRREAN